MIQIAGYSVDGQIGRGGMATVYRARQTLLDRDVALKVMSRQLAQDPVYAQRFLQEARMLAALNHPHVVPVYDVGVTPDGLHYFSMQLLTGGDFNARMRDGLSELELVRVLVAVAHALGFAHARGYVHRDVTPANILFDAHDTPILTDFGIARAISATSRITASGLSIGTSHYMSPEQARGAEVDHRSDIYSLGVLCFEAVAGRPPYEGADGFAVAFAHVHDPVPRLPEEAARWQPLIDRAMAKHPDDRFPDCAAFIDGLREVAPDEFRALGPAVVGAPTRRVSTASPMPGGSESRGRRRLQWPGALRRIPHRLQAIDWRWPALPRREQWPSWPFLLGGALAAALLLTAGWLAVSGNPVATDRIATIADNGAAKPALPSAAPASRVEVPTAMPDPFAAATGSAEPETADGALDTASDAVVVADPQTVIDPVATLLALGRSNLERLRLSVPADNNALGNFQTALLIEPGNRDAAAGIAAVAQAYLDLAAKRDPLVEFDAWAEQLANAERVAALHADAAPKAAAVQAERRRFVATQIDHGQAALARWDREAAREAFTRARQLAPDDPAVRRGLREAGRVGTVGYRFDDPIDDRRGPALVVVSEGLALGRSEVTVGEFREWWNAAGKTAFADLPRCRDRDALFAFSRKRTWSAPDLAQTDRHPVVCVSQPMAAAYAAWLAERSGQPYRLPRADELLPLASTPATPCSSNLRDADYRKAFGGRDGADCSDGHAGTAPVGSFEPVAPGLLDIDGNVREWVSDCDAGCRNGVIVGRGWHSAAGAPIRDTADSGQAFNTVGFRIARELDR